MNNLLLSMLSHVLETEFETKGFNGDTVKFQSKQGYIFCLKSYL